MKPNRNQEAASPVAFSARIRWLVFVVCALALLFGRLRVTHPSISEGPTSIDHTTSAIRSPSNQQQGHISRFVRHAATTTVPTAEEVVAGKLQQFSRSRRELAREMARRKGVAVPDEVENFFDAMESGDWDEIDRQWKLLAKKSRQYDDSTDADSPRLDPVWSAVLDAYGVAEQVHEWPAQKLLDYGNAILDSLRPGMVYVGGTDYGRWIPTLLNETSDRAPYIIITQNALADGRYLEYITTLYGNRLTTLSEEDFQRTFRDYVADAHRRLEHDRQFPDEPKQLRFGEEVNLVDGKVQVGGQVAVMSINERLLQAFQDRNPSLDFAIQESTPLQGTYADALPLGPLMELRARDEETTFTPERAAQSLDYWRKRAQQVQSDPEAMGSAYALKSYSHDTVSTANLLAAHNFTAEAEEAYHLAGQLWPGNPESIGGLADLLMRSGREAEARKFIEDFNRTHPDQQKDLERISAAARSIGTAQQVRP